MKVSIITICYNRALTIEKCIQSVINQGYQNIEYIVIDGNSNDGTKDIIAKYKNNISHYISEPDDGMYHAINKGLEIATGDIVGLMHSDDEFFKPDIVSKIVHNFLKYSEIDAICGDGIMVTDDDQEKVIRNRIGSDFAVNKIKKGWLPLHPTFYLKRKLLKKYGFYDLNFKIASDTEFLLRYLYRHRIRLKYLNFCMVKMRMGGLSTSSDHIVKVLKEDLSIYRYHNISALKAVFFKKYLTLKEYLKKGKGVYS